MIGRMQNKKYFKIVISIIILAMILFIAGMMILKYNVEGETNMPFRLSKISIISSSQGMDKEAIDTKWAFDISQNNDIYLYIDKNSGYGKTEIIESVKIDQIKIESLLKDDIKIYKPEEQEEKMIFKNEEKNNVQEILYKGEMESDLKQLKISNQGGLVAFRCAINNLAEYISNEEQINHQELLKKAGVTKEDIKLKITFDLTIVLQKGKEYKATIYLDLPVGDVIEEGTTSEEITNTKDFIFKRVNN